MIDALRRRPVIDLTAALPPSLTPTNIVDLGCGSGQLSRMLAAHWPQADVLAVDNSPAMLRWAAETPSRVRYLQADLAGWRPHWPADLVISAGGLHRVADHDRLFPELLQSLAAGGVLAIAMPRPQDQPAHRLLLETAAGGPWADRLAGALTAMPRHAAQDYYDWLAPQAASVELWETGYFHAVDSDVPLLQWLHQAALAPVMDRLSGPDLDGFLTAYRRRLEGAYPQHSSGSMLIPTGWLFIVAQARNTAAIRQTPSM
ncbi:trans-aconitate methyltransferase [Azospirillum thiophilum]|uniref:Trans-aconitate methyltransferase n=1 Tax=Azospirillum thiophilum TaxID=528244 RepID=A0AAC8VUT1_9PROT|nr:methyltransferase domain-containing protein [Azospirillum thiophilum]ALG69897.1 trans-aconitate methyltransferase [Azospirillum thiophilum]KJR66417.1 trans-aconitate methyltransferase [Azospirillum thiophilum]